MSMCKTLEVIKATFIPPNHTDSSKTSPSLLHFPFAMFVILSAALCGEVQGLIRVINTRPRTVPADDARKRVMSVFYNCLAMKGLMATRDTNAFHTRNLKL